MPWRSTMGTSDADFRRSAKKLAEAADFTTDIATWPDEMVNAYLESFTEEQARTKFEQKLLQGVPRA